MKNYEDMLKAELLSLAKQLDIKGRHKMKKEELIEEIKQKENGKAQLISAANKPENMVNQDIKDKYINSANIGTFVALMNDEKVITGEIVSRNEQTREIIIKRKLGKIIKAKYEDVLWIKKENKDKWPKDIYKMIKGDKIER